jgi:hypothetical protein
MSNITCVDLLDHFAQKQLRLLKNYFSSVQPIYRERRISSLRIVSRSEIGISETFSTVSCVCGQGKDADPDIPILQLAKAAILSTASAERRNLHTDVTPV